MLLFPNCKINLGLNIVAKRPDGYHDLETVFFPIPLTDVLEAVHGTGQFTSSGLAINGDPSDNLCIRAYNLLKQDFPQLPPLDIHLHKNIPMGAGLGGGSSDGAFMLQLLNKKFNLQIPNEKLIDYALQLGSDCPFFIINKPCFATGRGEVMTPIALDLPNFQLVVVNPGIHVSTREAFAGLTPKQPVKSINKIIHQPIETWKDELMNDFEETIFRIHPHIQAIKEELYNKGAVYASMTGTGSTVYGIFPKGVAPAFSFNNHFIQWIQL
ncbi:4-(cytidine 5'-diphospho)-2-C-methyl-D-erythritol kinase [Aridibaculum aurantiacum]|uniref:4-(cytidine 5'-diphospho)-2-C-methyl-D-erythritol kinase n=1 Tax=Aridibaculum aurantiacum TaxID=2810307 RepID=UPI001A96ECE2|nr:4-(cytidine 5'-diphospho)-2-C-methyl-D-erythritol kinase [Aridibaculum aurantiacum]